MIHSWQGFFALLLGPQRLPTIQILTTTASVLTVGAIIVLLCKVHPLRRSTEASHGDKGRIANNWSAPSGMLQFAALTLAALLISPHLLTYDLTIALLPMLLCVVVASDDRLTQELRRELLLLAGGLYVATTLSTGIANSIGLQISTVALAVVVVRVGWIAGSFARAEDTVARRTIGSSLD